MLSEHQQEIPADADVPSETTGAFAVIEPDPDRVKAGSRLLAVLYNLKLFDSIISRLYTERGHKILPQFIIDKILYATRRVYDSFGAAEIESRLREFTLQIFQNSSKPIPRSKDMAVDEYIATFTGPNTRWETIAFIFATGGVGLLSCSDDDPMLSELRGNDGTSSSELKERLVLQFSDAASSSLMLCDQASSSNEILAFAQFSDVTMKTQQYGDSSKSFLFPFSFFLCFFFLKKNEDIY